MALPGQPDNLELRRAAVPCAEPGASSGVIRFAGLCGRGREAAGAPGRLVAWRVERDEPADVHIAGCPHIRVGISGNIDNLGDLTRELSDLGHRPVSATPDEIIAHAYEEWGEGCIARLWGMFALALWDERARILLLARDRSGARTIYYSDLGDRFVYASHVSALRAVTALPQQVDPQAVDCYLTFGAVPAPLSIYRSVRALPAAHLLKLESGDIVVKRYWSPGFQPKRRVRVQDAADQFDALLRDVIGRAVHNRTCGVMLSGGLDSAILLLQLAAVSPRPVPAFTFDFSGSPGRTQAAGDIAARLGSASRVFHIEARVADVLPDIVARQEQPCASPAALSFHYMYKPSHLHGQVNVVFSGEGADEVFSGRERHLASDAAGRIQRVPGGRLAAAIGARLSAGQAGFFFRGVALGSVDRHMLWVSTFQPSARRRLYTPGFADQIDVSHGRRLTEQLMAGLVDPLEQELAADLGFWMPDVIWPSLDPTRGAAGLEIRAPFLDHRIVDFSASLPASLKIRRWTPKAFLRQTYAGRVSVRSPRLRRGGPKIALASLLKGDLRSTMEDTLLSAQALERGYFRPDVIRQLIREHLTDRRDHARQLWALVMLEQWHRRWLDRGDGAR